MCSTTITITITIKEDNTNMIGFIPTRDNSNIDINVRENNACKLKKDDVFYTVDENDTIINKHTKERKNNDTIIHKHTGEPKNN
ncbi:131R [Yaba monkey tumor virus]|uniref:131R n=1 Tax=Yaba monkey tumor virus (strain VR587) TaxID=928314 RepID=Q6TUN9_YMTV5|nr:hypothetical protein YMTVg131R [Yaba monkey tumor virus]AAR07487.1 131R [Yaba monkey tumor virus]